MRPESNHPAVLILKGFYDQINTLAKRQPYIGIDDHDLEVAEGWLKTIERKVKGMKNNYEHQQEQYRKALTLKGLIGKMTASQVLGWLDRMVHQAEDPDDVDEAIIYAKEQLEEGK